MGWTKIISKIYLVEESLNSMGQSLIRTFFSKIERGLSPHGFKMISSGVYINKVSENWNGWVSISGNNFIILPLIGVCNKKINEIIYRILKRIYNGPFNKNKIDRFYLPTAISSLRSVIIENKYEGGRIPWDYNGTKLTEDVSQDLIDCILDLGLNFIHENCDMEKAIEIALKCSKYHHAQQYSIPVMFVILGRMKELDIYVDEITSKLSIDDNNIKLYMKYIEEIRGISF